MSPNVRKWTPNSYLKRQHFIPDANTPFYAAKNAESIAVLPDTIS